MNSNAWCRFGKSRWPEESRALRVLPAGCAEPLSELRLLRRVAHSDLLSREQRGRAADRVSRLQLAPNGFGKQDWLARQPELRVDLRSSSWHKRPKQHRQNPANLREVVEHLVEAGLLCGVFGQLERR